MNEELQGYKKNDLVDLAVERCPEILSAVPVFVRAP